MRTIIAGQDQIKLFNSICIETAAKCNRTCFFCPNNGTDRPDDEMPWGVVEKIAEELGRLKYSGRISPYIYNEPMRDTRLPDFLRLMRKACPRANLMTNTNGDYIRRREDVLDLFAAGLDSIVINIYAAKDNTARGIALADKRYERLSSMFAEEGSGSAYLKKGVVEINRKYGKYFEGGHKKTNRSGNIEWSAAALTEPLKKTCVRPWRVLNINWKGEAILCCNDYHGEETFGNVADRSIVDIWNDMRLHEIRAALQNRDRTIVPLCAKCDFYGGAYQHMLTTVQMPGLGGAARAPGRIGGRAVAPASPKGSP
jgi:MoaA/NifB/PqqE/SkfB family radical SAM enzyme